MHRRGCKHNVSQVRISAHQGDHEAEGIFIWLIKRDQVAANRGCDCTTAHVLAWYIVVLRDVCGKPTVMCVEMPLSSELPEQRIDKREGYTRRNACSINSLDIVGFFKRPSTRHLAATGNGIGPAEQSAIAKTLLAVGCAFQTHGIRPVTAKAASAAVMAGLANTRTLVYHGNRSIKRLARCRGRRVCTVRIRQIPQGEVGREFRGWDWSGGFSNLGV